MSRPTQWPVQIANIEGLVEVTEPLPSGVYFLVHEAKVMYVGQSVDPISRVAEHRKTGVKFTRAATIWVPAEMLDAVEGALIRFLKPPLNGNGGKGDPDGDAPILETLGLISSAPSEPHPPLSPPTHARVTHRPDKTDRPAVLRESEAARYVGMSRAFLKRARMEGKGPAFVRIQRSIVYRVVDLDQWLARHLVRFDG